MSARPHNDTLSEPQPSGVPRSVTSAASPPEEPPHVRAELYGFEAGPKIGLELSKASSVCGMFVLQNGMPPCARYSLTSWQVSHPGMWAGEKPGSREGRGGLTVPSISGSVVGWKQWLGRE